MFGLVLLLARPASVCLYITVMLSDFSERNPSCFLSATTNVTLSYEYY